MNCKKKIFFKKEEEERHRVRVQKHKIFGKGGNFVHFYNKKGKQK